MRLSRCLLAVLFGTAAVAAPVIGPPVNQASFDPPGSLTYGIAQGAMFAVFGTEMGPAELVVASAFPLTTELAGTSAQVTVGGETVDCILVFTSAGQIAAILPSATPLGDGEIRVTYAGETSDPQPIRVVAHGVGMFTIPQNGRGPAVVTDANFAVNTYVNSFAPGTVGIAWVTGLGARTADDRAVAEDLKDVYDVRVGVGGVEARVLYAGPSGCCAAVDQVVYEIPSLPEDVRTGCAVPVVVTAGDTTSNFASISVSDDGAVCGDEGQFSSEQVALLHSQGSLRVFNAVVTGFDSVLGPSLDAGTAAALGEEEGKDFGEGTGWSLGIDEDLITPDNFYRRLEPAVGTCTVIPSIEEPRREAPFYTGRYEARAVGRDPFRGAFGGETAVQRWFLAGRPDSTSIFIEGSPEYVIFRQPNPHLADNWGSYADAVAADIPRRFDGLWSQSSAFIGSVPTGQTFNTLHVFTSTAGGLVNRGFVACNRTTPGRFVQGYYGGFLGGNQHVQVLTGSRVAQPFNPHATGGRQSLFRGLEDTGFSQDFYSSPGATVAATAQSEVTPEGYFVSANFNFNDLGMTFSARYAGPPEMTGWGLYVDGNDAPLVRGAVPAEGDTFSARRLLGDLSQGDPSWITVREMIANGEVEFGLTVLEGGDGESPQPFLGSLLRF